MLTIPSAEIDILAWALQLIEDCRISVGARTNYCRLMNVITETGKMDGSKSLLNMIYMHLSRKAEHIFSPVELKFTLDFDRVYPREYYEKAAVVGKNVTRHWERTSTDYIFGEGVFESLKYGACILKQFVQSEGEDHHPDYYAKLVSPWNFGVYNESENDLNRQPAFVETTSLTLPEIWRRIYHLPDAKKLFERIKGNAKRGNLLSEPASYVHQVLSTSQLQTGVQQSTRPLPGGIVQLGNDPNFFVMGPQVAAETVVFHEIWVQDFDDYKTIQVVEPDILVSPYGRKMNVLGVTGKHPYTLIQMNAVTDYFWGRSEIVDIIEPQELVSYWLDDAKRLMGLQIDKFLGFIGNTQITEELYSAMRSAGYVNLEQGSQITDLTPKFPPELLPMVEFLIKQINLLSGFPEIMRGQGEAGVRAGVHADTLMKTASPQLRGEALRAERQCATAADLTLRIMEAKDPTRYWTKADTPDDIDKTSFLLTDMPGDWRVAVDSHSSSPIFSDENTQLIMASHQRGIVDGEYVLDNMPFPDRDMAKARLKAKEQQQQKMMQDLMHNRPELYEKLMEKQMGGGKKR